MKTYKLSIEINGKIGTIDFAASDMTDAKNQADAWIAGTNETFNDNIVYLGITRETGTETENLMGSWKVDGKLILAIWRQFKENQKGSIWIYQDGWMAAFGCSLEHAQEVVNRLAEQPVWTA